MSNSECHITNGQPRDRERLGETGAASPAILESLIASSPQLHGTNPNRPGLTHAAMIGTVTGWCETGQPLVLAEAFSDVAFPARTVVAADYLQPGMQVVLMFEQGDPTKPLLTGIVQQPAITEAPQLQAAVDNERLMLTADREIVLKCGKASITLTKSGKILIRGAYVLNRSSGVNRIKGGVVHIN